MARVTEINDIQELDSRADDWGRLLRATPEASFFQSLDWLRVYWRHFGADKRLRVLVVDEGGSPIGILPLVVAREKTKVGRLRFLTYPLDYWGSVYGPLGAQPQATLEAALAHVAATRRHWDVVDLRWAVGDQCALTEAAMSAAGLPPRPGELEPTSVVDLPDRWDDFLAARTSKWRNNLKRSEKRIAALGDVTHRRIRPDANQGPAWDVFEECLRIARASWQASSTDGTTLSHASIEPFMRDVHEAAARCGALDVNLLSLDGQPFAFAYNYHYRGRVDGVRSGYDAEVSRDGVGTVLYARALEDSILRGDRLYDLGPGSLDCKRHFRTRVVPIYRYSYFARFALRANLLRLKRFLDARRAAGKSKGQAA